MDGTCPDAFDRSFNFLWWATSVRLPALGLLGEVMAVRRFLLSAVALPTLLALSTPWPAVAAVHQRSAVPGEHGRPGHFQWAGQSVVSSLRLSSPGSHPAIPTPSLQPDLKAYRAAKNASPTVVAGRRDGLITLPLPLSGSNSRDALPAATRQATTASPIAFPGMSLERQIAQLGKDHFTFPPDTQLAAGPDSLLEMVNFAGAIWTKAGFLVKAFDLNAFFEVRPGFSTSDPRVTYDSVSGRWFVSALSFNAVNDSFIHLAVSQSADPSAAWNIYFAGPFQGVLADQPKLGTSNGVVALSWNDFTAKGSFIGSETWIIQKSDVLAGGSSAAAVSFGPDALRFGLVPATNQGPTDTEYIVYNNAGALRNTSSPTVGVISVTGTPATGNVTFTESDPVVAATMIPPRAEQPWDLPVDTGDDRFLSAVWQNNLMWIGGNDRCTPTGDTAARSCLHLIQISTAGTPAVVQDLDAAIRGVYLTYPAVAIDGSGDLFFVFSAMSREIYGSVITSGQLAGSTTLQPATLLKGGEGPISNYDKSIGVNRWGDYSGAALDPLDPTEVWFAGEYAATSTSPLNWGTEIGTIGGASPPDTAAPTISGVRAAPNPFTPNGDGNRDKVHIYWRVSEGAVETTVIRDSKGRIVYLFPGYVTKGAWQDIWNGRNRRGRRVAPGRYRYSLQAVDAVGNRSKVARGVITVEL